MDVEWILNNFFVGNSSSLCCRVEWRLVSLSTSNPTCPPLRHKTGHPHYHLILSTSYFANFSFLAYQPTSTFNLFQPTNGKNLNFLFFTFLQTFLYAEKPIHLFTLKMNIYMNLIIVNEPLVSSFYDLYREPWFMNCPMLKLVFCKIHKRERNGEEFAFLDLGREGC